MAMLRRGDYMPTGERLSIGEEVAINHCKQGDSNRALYVKRDEKGVLAYCHHCGGTGAALLSSRGVPIAKKKQNKGNYPTEWTYNMEDWQEWARIIMFKAGLSGDDTLFNGIGYASSTDQIVLEVRNAGRLMGYQYRNNPSNRVKYISRYLEVGIDTALRVHYLQCKGSSYKYSGTLSACNVLVICEDILSAIKIYKTGKASSLALLGTSSPNIYSIAERYKHIVIFLDDDNLQVKLNQLKIRDQLRLYTSASVKVYHSSGIDPKEHSLAMLKQIIKEVTLDES